MNTEETENSKAVSFYESSEDGVKVDETKESISDDSGNKEDQTPVDKEEPQENKNESEAESKNEESGKDYELKDIESKLPEEELKSVIEEAKKLGLSKEQAQSFAKLKEETQSASLGQVQSQIDEMKKGWLETIKADPEIGGDNLVAAAEHAKRFVDAYGTPELIKFLDDSGLSNHPEFLRAFSRAGKDKLDESKWISGTTPKTKLSPAEIMYGTNKSKE